MSRFHSPSDLEFDRQEREADSIERAMEAASRDLEPCPFCGDSEAPRVIQSQRKFAEDQFLVECDGCGVCGPPRLSPERAAALWNDRREPKALHPFPLPKAA